MSKINKKLIDNLSKLVKQTEEEYNESRAFTCQMKIKAYKKGLDIIKSFSQEIKTSSDVKGIGGIGKGIMTRIDEILKTGKLAELKPPTKNSALDEITQLELITGIGPKGAHKLYDNNITLKILLKQLDKVSKGDDPRDLTIDEIIQNSEEMSLNLHDMTHHQLVGLKYFHDINERIPRKEMAKLESKLDILVTKFDSDLDTTVCGSYRRGNLDSGDIDVLITHRKLATEEDIAEHGTKYLINVIKYLTEHGLLVDHLTSHGTTKYMGICRLNNNHKGRRIDIRFVARNDYAPALLYFTGSKTFNQLIRGEALKKGYTINEYGIYKLRKMSGKYIKKAEKCVVHTEKDIFDLVGMKYLDPEERI
jgi:DNA polymerase beta